jgi:hypothetical protein
VTYNADTKTATISLSGALPARRYQLIVRSSITDLAGNALGNGANFVGSLDVAVPILAPIGEKSVYDTNLLTFTATATNPAGGALAFSLGQGAPTGAGIAASGVFTWMPTESQAGAVYKVKIIVGDNSAQQLTDSEIITITVLPNPAPVLQTITINNGAAQRSFVASLTLQFSENVSASLATNDLTLRNLTAGADVAQAGMALSYDTANNKAALTFPGLPNGKLADGNYRLTVTGVLGVHGKPMAADFTFSFYVLTGDVNADRVTNDLDLYQVWQNLLKPSANRNLNEDLNKDGQVTLADVAIVKGNYLAKLPAALKLAALPPVLHAVQADAWGRSSGLRVSALDNAILLNPAPEPCSVLSVAGQTPYWLLDRPVSASATCKLAGVLGMGSRL